jgi:parvulin-like peptidyl-prolyl isomerase
VDVQKTAFFARNESVEGVGQSREFAQVAFTLDEGEISEPVALSDGYYILEVIDRKAAQIPELSSVREEVKKDVTQIKADEAAREKAEAFLASIKEGTTFEDAAERFDVDIKDTGFFKRSDPIPDVGRERRFVEQAFSLKPSAPIADSVIQGGSAFYVIRLKERQDADMADFEAQKKQIETRLISGKRQKRMEEWFAQLRQQGEVSIKKGFLD